MKVNEHTILIIGGVAGGATAAARARRHSETSRIILIERGPDVSFANCGLPYHIGGEIPERKDLALQTPASLRQLLNLEVLVRTEAISIQKEERTVTVRDLTDGTEREISYDQLILAPGAAPLRPPLPGIDHPRIVTLRNLQDMDRILDLLPAIQKVAIIGAGFIGLEMAEQLVHRGKQVEVIELQSQILPQMDAEMVSSLQNGLRQHGVTLHLGDGIQGFSEDGAQVVCQLNSGKTIAADLVLLSIGVRPESQLARDAGLTLGARGHIVVNRWMQTSDPAIYAAGDVCEGIDPILGGASAVPLGGPANRQGRTVADHIFMGNKALPYPGSIGTAILRLFDQAAGVTGWTEKRLKAAGIPYESVTVNGASHASYYPSAEMITLKVLWSPEDRRILGAQAHGKDGVDKRLDIIATAIRGRMTVDDLTHLELSYAPPFGSAKDVVNVAGFAAGNMRDGLLLPVASLAEAGEQIVDVRPADAATKQPVPGSISIPLPELRSRMDELDRRKPVYVICRIGRTSYFGARILANHGFTAYSILGGAYHQLQ
jgi:NADPH-dependent 2,4-dienoyl-CoA reductase/sulfur reductase-like enzyme/rhodanese-related sulfurtransferase